MNIENLTECFQEHGWLRHEHGERSVNLSQSVRACRISNHRGKTIAEGPEHDMIGVFAQIAQTDLSDDAILNVFQGKPRMFSSHYDYLDTVLPHFWKLVFGKTMDEMWCGGIVSAHGDKAYGYDHTWGEANIPFQHGVMLFLLSYTKQYPEDLLKSESAEWVIEQHSHYLPMIKQAERTCHVIVNEEK